MIFTSDFLDHQGYYNLLVSTLLFFWCKVYNSGSSFMLSLMFRKGKKRALFLALIAFKLLGKLWRYTWLLQIASMLVWLYNVLYLSFLLVMLFGLCGNMFSYYIFIENGGSACITFSIRHCYQRYLIWRSDYTSGRANDTHFGIADLTIKLIRGILMTDPGWCFK